MSGNKLYVGNIPFKMTEADLSRLFSDYGAVSRATVVTDRETGRPRGFAFVEMGSDAEAQAAIDALDGKSIEGRAIRVNVARPREDREGGGGGGGRGFGGGGGGGYGGGRGRGGGGGGGGYSDRGSRY